VLPEVILVILTAMLAAAVFGCVRELLVALVGCRSMSCKGLDVNSLHWHRGALTVRFCLGIQCATSSWPLLPCWWLGWGSETCTGTGPVLNQAGVCVAAHGPLTWAMHAAL